MSQNALESIVRVEITDEPLIPGRSGTNERGPWTIPTKQAAYLWQGDRYPTRIEITCPEAGAFRPGTYLIGGKALVARVVGTRSVVQLDDRGLTLIPLDALKQSLKAA